MSLMTWLFGALVIVLIGAIAVVASGRGESMEPGWQDRPDVTIPGDRPLTGDDLRGLEFTTALRGYRADEVDALLERLAEQLDGPAAGPRPPA